VLGHKTVLVVVGDTGHTFPSVQNGISITATEEQEQEQLGRRPSGWNKSQKE